MSVSPWQAELPHMTADFLRYHLRPLARYFLSARRLTSAIACNDRRADCTRTSKTIAASAVVPQARRSTSGCVAAHNPKLSGCYYPTSITAAMAQMKRPFLSSYMLLAIALAAQLGLRTAAAARVRPGDFLVSISNTSQSRGHLYVLQVSSATLFAVWSRGHIHPPRGPLVSSDDWFQDLRSCHVYSA